MPMLSRLSRLWAALILLALPTFPAPFLFPAFAHAAPAIAKNALPARPKLVLLLVIDQFRSDYLLRFSDRFLPAAGKGGDVGGFKYLMTQGAYYPMAEYNVLQSMTCPGHATILTGALPYQMGIALNGWSDPATGEYVYCAEDPAHSTVGVPTVPHIGTSPKHLVGTTLGDELKNGGYPSRVVTIALKDRSAIMLGGHRADLALWMDKGTHKWVSSSYYLPDKKLPSWVEGLNTEIAAAENGKTTRFEALGKGTGLSDDKYQPASDADKLGKTLPHELPANAKLALILPHGLELTEGAAERALDAYGLGKGKATDVLAVSFSSHDYMAHAFGPNSREMEEMTVIEDRLIAKLLNRLRKQLPGGLKDVVIALTADHGGPPDPDYAKAHRLDAGRIDAHEMSVAIEKRLTAKFGSPAKDAKWLSMNHDLGIFFSRKTLVERKTDLNEAASEVKAFVQTLPGVAHAFTAQDYFLRKLPPGLHEKQILATYFPGRSADVTIIPKPFWMSCDETLTHQTGYAYDRMVPLVLAGSRLKPGNYPQHARVIDLAPTLAYLLGIMPPALSEGRVLHEAIR